MKFLLIDYTDKDQKNILDAIIEFLWDSGHEVDRIYHDQFISNEHKNYDCVISITSDIDHSDKENNFFNELKTLTNCKNTSITLLFSKSGVYTDVIPYPHLIFSYPILTLKSLELFFDWCRKFHLFHSRK